MSLILSNKRFAMSRMHGNKTKLNAEFLSSFHYAHHHPFLLKTVVVIIIIFISVHIRIYVYIDLQAHFICKKFHKNRIKIKIIFQATIKIPQHSARRDEEEEQKIFPSEMKKFLVCFSLHVSFIYAPYDIHI